MGSNFIWFCFGYEILISVVQRNLWVKIFFWKRRQLQIWQIFSLLSSNNFASMERLWRTYDFNPLHFNYKFSLKNSNFSSLFIIHFPWYAQGKEVSNNQELMEFAIISFILVTLALVLGLILRGEIRCLPLLGVKSKFCVSVNVGSWI